MKVIIDAKSSDKHYIVSYTNGKPFIWIAKSKNTLGMVIKQIGLKNIKEIIQWEKK